MTGRGETGPLLSATEAAEMLGLTSSSSARKALWRAGFTEIRGYREADVKQLAAVRDGDASGREVTGDG